MALSGQKAPKSRWLTIARLRRCRLEPPGQLSLRQRMQVAHQTFQTVLDYVGIDLGG